MFRRVMTLSLCMLVSGCAVVQTDYNYDAGYDFSGLRQYSWLEMPIDFQIDHFSMQHIKTAIDRQLKIKGYTLTTEPGEFIISLQGYKDTVRQSPQSTSHSRVSGQRHAADQHQHGSFTITMIDTKTDRQIWQGYAKGVVAPTLSTREKAEKNNQIVATLLADFPPD